MKPHTLGNVGLILFVLSMLTYVIATANTHWIETRILVALAPVFGSVGVLLAIYGHIGGDIVRQFRRDFHI